jgi:hypothetical protein
MRLIKGFPWFTEREKSKAKFLGSWPSSTTAYGLEIVRCQWLGMARVSKLAVSEKILSRILAPFVHHGR